MARISLKDLPRSDALDQRALRAIAGGALCGARASLPAGTAGPYRIVDYPPGFDAQRAAAEGSAKR